MYYEHFGLKENPFHTTPDPRYLYLSRRHQEAMDHLVYGITQRKGFVMVTGGVGTGKTTLLRSLLADLDANAKTALILNPFVSEDDLLPTICDEFGIAPPQSPGKKSYLDAINAFLLKTFAAGQNAVLLLDEAQNLSRDVLEQVRILSNLETDQEKLLQIVLVGQEELVHLLGLNDLRQLNERIVVRYSLDALDFEDSKAYVQHRMMVAGCKGRTPFTKSAFKTLYARSQGVPRRINAICDRALLAAYSHNQKQVSASLISQAAHEVTGRAPEVSARAFFPAYAALVAVLAMAGGLGLGYGIWQGRTVSIAAQPAVARETAAAPVPSPAPEAKPAAPELQTAPQETVTQPVTRETAAPAARNILDPPPEDAASAPLAMAQELGPQAVEESGGAAPAPPAAQEPANENETWILDGEKSLAQLFTLYNNDGELKRSAGDGQAGIVSFRADAARVRLFQRPFRASLHGFDDGLGGHAVVLGVTPGGFDVASGEGKKLEISVQEFNLVFSGGLVWLIPERLWASEAGAGSDGPLVRWIQEVLNESGYLLEKDGVYGPQTSRAIRRFQQDFGIRADGVAGSTTIGLLFQLSRRLPELAG